MHSSHFSTGIAICLLACLLAWAAVTARGDDSQAIERQFGEVMQPFLKTYCLGCHGMEKQEGKLDLSGYGTLAAVTKNQQVWELVLERLKAKEMPPEDAPKLPTEGERNKLVKWIEAMREAEAQRNAGDPGPVLARRLSNAEYDYTIRDLTGVDLRPTREFPVDRANEAGFDNSGESLSMSPALVKKYLAAARNVADHLVLKPQGFALAPHVAVTETDRDKYCVQRIVDFYKRQKTDIADYLFAAWRYERRGEFAKPQMALEDFAKEAGISTKYLRMVWSALHDDGLDAGRLGDLREGWRKLSADSRKQDEARRECEKLRDLVINRRMELSPKVRKMEVNGISPGSQPLVLWKNREIAAQRMKYVPPEANAAVDEKLRKSLERFCQVFPDAFYIADRAPYFEEKSAPSGRLLTAGFHLMQGYFRDDGPLYELILDEAGCKELDGLWRELNFVTSTPERQYKDFIFFERAEPPRYMREAPFDFARSEDKDAGAEAKIQRLREEYLKKAKEIKAGEKALKAIDDYFVSMNADIRWVESARLAAEPSHLVALQRFAERAYRRPLKDEENSELLAFYRSLREKEGLSHEEAMRDCVASVLMSPTFLFRVDLEPRGKNIQPLDDYSLANRLSYFLWSSMPDEELLSHAAAGNLRQPEVLLAQTRRMLKDKKVRGLAVEFGGNWLDFRRFEEHNSVDRERFAAFDDELRQAMFEEPVRFFLDVVQENRSVLDFLSGEHTFVNPVLAKHYGMPAIAGDSNNWVRVDDAGKYGRGGLLPMSVFLTKNSPGLRTSPVKRGYWVARRILGERIPPPPPTVPELPKDEAALGELTLAQLLAKHRENKSCASCHARFDSLGLVYENFGPIGERREKDLSGHSVETNAVFPGGSEGEGVAGLRTYLLEKRQDEFIDNLCRKLLSYALGRTLLLSDKALVENMKEKLAADDYRCENLVDSIVTSRQFLNKDSGPHAETQRSQGRRIKMNRSALSRRTVLQGVGVAMALPWLESMSVWGAEDGRDAASGEKKSDEFPTRFAALFMGNGISPNNWWAKGAGEEMELSKTLEPLAPFKSKLNIVNGLFNKNATHVGIHPGQTGNILSGASLQKGAVLRGGISMDQVLAAKLGDETPQPSLVLGCEQPITGYHETNFSMAYSSHISWQDADSPVPMEVYPSLAFDSLFDNHGSRRMQSILDRVRDHAAHLSRQVSRSDQAKLDEYLTSVREVEKQIERTRALKDKAEENAAGKDRPAAAMPRPDNGLPEDIREHMRLMTEIIALAFQTNKTRVATLLLCRDISGLFYPFLDVRTAHHNTSHDDQGDDYERVSRFYVSQLVHLATRLAAMPEGERTVLDHSCLMFINSMWSGSQHDSSKVPLLLVGGLAGQLDTGRVLDFKEKGDDNRKLCGLYLSLMDKMGAKQERFGDAEGKLEGL